MRIALGSASKNALLILKRIGLLDQFDAVIDGNQVTLAKPDPEVFLKAAIAIGAVPGECLVFEDAEAGVQAALRAQMQVVGIGSAAVLGDASLVLEGFQNLSLQQLLERISQIDTPALIK